jgi:hypothetical protein
MKNHKSNTQDNSSNHAIRNRKINGVLKQIDEEEREKAKIERLRKIDVILAS